MTGWLRSQRLILFAVMLLLCCAFIGCNRYKSYRILRVVFDGVPFPDQLADADARRVKEVLLKRPEPSDKDILQIIITKFQHPSSSPQNECSICHGPLGKMETPPKDMCMKCHTHIKKGRAFIHGPAALDCAVCHDVHDSTTKSLLKKSEEPLCFDCHYSGDPERAFEIEAHQLVRDDEQSCLSCHDPHGGNDRFFLKKDVMLRQDRADTEQQNSIREETITEESIQGDS